MLINKTGVKFDLGANITMEPLQVRIYYPQPQANIRIGVASSG
jgi:hypothetical protein